MFLIKNTFYLRLYGVGLIYMFLNYKHTKRTTMEEKHVLFNHTLSTFHLRL